MSAFGARMATLCSGMGSAALRSVRVIVSLVAHAWAGRLLSCLRQAPSSWLRLVSSPIALRLRCRMLPWSGVQVKPSVTVQHYKRDRSGELGLRASASQRRSGNTT